MMYTMSRKGTNQRKIQERPITVARRYQHRYSNYKSTHCDNKRMAKSNANSPVEVLIPDASDALKQAIDFRREIGWENIFKGRLDITWGEMYNHQHSTGPPSEA
jgi:hypothetical protein